jgi:hypothetical protein
MADAGVPLHTLRKIAGYADVSTTQRYLHPDRQSVAGAGELLSKHLWSQNGSSSESSDPAPEASLQLRRHFSRSGMTSVGLTVSGTRTYE